MIYRVLKALDTGHKPGDVVPGDLFYSDQIRQILMNKKAIAPVSAPPMEELPGWSLRAERFGRVNIDTIKFLEMDDQSLAEAIGSKPRVVAKWREELKGWLGIDGQVKPCNGCR